MIFNVGVLIWFLMSGFIWFWMLGGVRITSKSMFRKNGNWSLTPPKRASWVSRWSKVDLLDMNIHIPGSIISDTIEKPLQIAKIVFQQKLKNTRFGKLDQKSSRTFEIQAKPSKFRPKVWNSGRTFQIQANC